MKLLNHSGQATVEYILLFAFMALIALSMVKAIGTGVSSSVGTLAFALTQELSTGICKSQCFYANYGNAPGN